MSEIVDDKSEHCVPFILQRLKHHRARYGGRGESAPPFFLGLNGVQGAGKTTLVSALHETLESQHSLPTVVLSIDDLYLPHDRQRALAQAHPDNPLVQHRGEPSTHDVRLGTELFAALASRKTDVLVPSYDKSAFNGAGDRRPRHEWSTVNKPGRPSVEIVIFEGWCVGFRALDDDHLERKWRCAKTAYETDPASYHGQLGKQTLDSVLFINSNLRNYDALTNRFDAFIHLDAEDTLYVYDWRQEQETAMRAAKGSGMTEQQVIEFINGYYPAYELYTDVLRKGIFGDEKGKQLRLVVDKRRRVTQVLQI